MKLSDGHSVLFVGHEATRTGAPIALLHILRWLKENSPYKYSIVLAKGGELEGEFQALAKTFVAERGHFHPWALPSRILRATQLSALARRAYLSEIRGFADRVSPVLTYVNSIASAAAVKLLAPQSPILLHVHELEFSYRAGVHTDDWGPLLHIADQFIACSNAVRDNLIEQHGIASNHVEVIHESIPIDEVQAKRTRDQIFGELGIPDDNLLIVGAGSLGWRKGSDLFIQIARTVLLRKPTASVRFAWVGGGTNWDRQEFEHDIRLSGLSERVSLLGPKDTPADYFAAADIFVLPSREDPYPLVCLEAAAVGTPIVCFDKAGGIPEFVESDCGFVVPYLSVEALAERVICLIESATLRARMGASAKAKAARHDTTIAGPRVLDIINRMITKNPQARNDAAR